MYLKLLFFIKLTKIGFHLLAFWLYWHFEQIGLKWWIHYGKWDLIFLAGFWRNLREWLIWYWRRKGGPRWSYLRSSARRFWRSRKLIDAIRWIILCDFTLRLGWREIMAPCVRRVGCWHNINAPSVRECSAWLGGWRNIIALSVRDIYCGEYKFLPSLASISFFPANPLFHPPYRPPVF